jgi:RNA polymerase sigma-70 factor (ECF subfamily)
MLHVDMQAAVQEQPTDHALRSALAALLPELRGFARYLAGSRSEADDLVQEAVLRTLHALDGRSDGVNLRAWCLSVIRNTFHEHLRLRKREAARLRDSVEPAPSPPLQETPAALRDLQRQLATLPPLLREALLLVGAQGLSHEEAATVCGVPIGTMKARVSRARRQLGAALGAVTR